MAGVAAGIALTLSELVTALVGWVVVKLRGGDLFHQVRREAEAQVRNHNRPSRPPPFRRRSGSRGPAHR